LTLAGIRFLLDYSAVVADADHDTPKRIRFDSVERGQGRAPADDRAFGAPLLDELGVDFRLVR
jgi:hypothetical protein